MIMANFATYIMIHTSLATYHSNQRSLQTQLVYFTMKRRGNGRFHAVSTWNTCGVLVGIYRRVGEIVEDINFAIRNVCHF